MQPVMRRMALMIEDIRHNNLESLAGQVASCRVHKAIRKMVRIFHFTLEISDQVGSRYRWCGKRFQRLALLPIARSSIYERFDPRNRIKQVQHKGQKVLRNQKDAEGLRIDEAGYSLLAATGLMSPGRGREYFATATPRQHELIGCLHWNTFATELTTSMAFSLQHIRGVWALTGPGIDQLVQTATDACPDVSHLQCNNKMPYHVTLVSKEELRDLPFRSLDQLQPTADQIDIGQLFSAGIGGGKNGVFFVVIIWANGQQLRKRLGLPPKHFHITLSPHDDHDMDKSISSLLHGQRSNRSLDFLDHSSFTSFTFSRYIEATTTAKELIALHPQSQKGFLRFADASFALGNFKDAMLAFAQTFERAEGNVKLQDYCIKKMAECSQETEWGTLLQAHESDRVFPDSLLAPWSTSLREKISSLELSPSLSLESRESLLIPTVTQRPYKLPRFFRWIIPYQLAAMSTPRNEEDINALALTSPRHSPCIDTYRRNTSTLCMV
ncbi:hypothetical protein NP233_g2670 [Leucocoprinus birnbaumii]|uniref:Swiss Army Knife 2H phosphoesterase domain-containing protein n=1 Tax=Leucocoprinus birnbaumii TaxID=56174 RepID=A0AAD5VYI1_9AGAR|nr:hypothetical protein NP233_g2670 [Leucocoprinus birnbaumii]